VMLVLRLQQYLAFQKRLSAVADTFSGIFDDLFHILIVLLLVCFFMGVLNCLAFGLYDPSFQHFPQAFAEMVLLCFALYKPAATTPFVPSMFKYVPHTMNDTEFMSWVPLLLGIMFKTVVTLLLFKLVMGVIMEGYKKHAKARLASHTIREDCLELFRHLYHYVWGHLVCRRPFVSFFHVALAIAQRKTHPDHPWEEYFLGLAHPDAVHQALNAVASSKESALRGSIHSRHLATSVVTKGLKECHHPEVDFVLRCYGTSRTRAEALFSDMYAKDKKAAELKKLAKVENKVDRTVEKDLDVSVQQSLSAVQALLVQIRKEDYRASKSDNVLISKKFWTTKELKEIFDDYDIMNCGTVDHILMPLLFRELGYKISWKKTAALLNDHNRMEDDQMNFKEFQDCIVDDKLIGHWKKPEGQRKDSLTAPLLQVDLEATEQPRATVPPGL